MQTSFYIKPVQNERIEATVHLTADTRPSLTGVVTDSKNKPVDGALVTVSTTEEPIQVLGAVYTDASGIFIFGPLSPGTLYQVRIYKGEEAARSLDT